jgi:signal transduction histidine kinase
VRIASFLKTTTFRLALLYAGLFCVSFVLLFGFIYWTADVLATRDRKQIIAADVQGLTDIFQAGGIDGLDEAISERTKPDRVGDGIYLLTSPELEPLSGNASMWPREAQRDGPWLTFDIQQYLFGTPEIHRAEALHVRLPGGFNLLVGRDMRTQVQFQQAITRSFFASLAIVLGLSVVAGLIMSRTILRRIDSINQAAERIMGGEVKHRMPVRGRHDEFDRLAENLNAMLEEIDRLMGSIRAVTNNIAHDLRSPLNRLRNRLEQMLTSKDDPAQHRESVEQAIGDADELLATFNALLSIADAEAGTSRGNLVPVDLEALANDVAELYEAVVEERGLVFEKSIRGPAVVPGNRQLLFQAIANLIDNAAKYGASGGKVRLSLDNDNGAPEIVVADHGPGIPEADRERVLERFVRLDASRTTPGNGLGLSLVAAIARLHSGLLVLEDNYPGLKVSLRFKPAAS